MSFGKMNTFIEIAKTDKTKDSEGFYFETDVIVANVRAYFEQKNSTEKWVNLSQNSSINALFRIRAIPNILITNKHFILCKGKRYNIFSVENVKNKGMYIEILGADNDGENFV